MSEPIVFVSHFRIKEGGFEDLWHSSANAIEAGKPGTLVFLSYVNDGGTQMSIVHVFADAEAMDVHFTGADQRSSAAYEYVVPDGWEIYGSPSETVLEQMRGEAASAGVPLTVELGFVSGFVRLQPASR